MKARHAPSLRPSAGKRLLVNVALGGLWVSGGLWLICHYFLRTTGEWGPEPHPLEPWWMRAHGVFAFTALWTLGLIWGAHVVGGWASGRRRVTGVLLLAWFATMALTAYLLLWGLDDGVWSVFSPIHWIAGLALPGGYLIHRFLAKPR